MFVIRHEAIEVQVLFMIIWKLHSEPMADMENVIGKVKSRLV